MITQRVELIQEQSRIIYNTLQRKPAKVWYDTIKFQNYQGRLREERIYKCNCIIFDQTYHIFSHPLNTYLRGFFTVLRHHQAGS